MSDSSDDENLDLLREAADSQFINDAMFKEKSTEKKNDEIIEKKLPSLRPAKDENEQFNLLNLTPQFQTYVAKQLSNLLEKQLKKLLSYDMEENCEIKRKHRKSGVRLFRNSERFIKVKHKDVSDAAQKKVEIKRRKLDNDCNISDDEETKAKAVAVSPEDVLSKRDIKFWSNRSKAKVYNYCKNKNGQLICTEI